MLFSALMAFSKSDWDLWTSVLVSLGASLILFSDIMNAWVHFVTSIPGQRYGSCLHTILPKDVLQLARLYIFQE